MLRIQLGESENCGGRRLSRRRALWVGGSGLLGGLTLPRFLQLRAEAPAADKKAAAAHACIFIFLEGGPSTIDMWDLKPDAPPEIRGPYRPIATAVPGIQIGEHLPLCARVADKFSILRSHSHNDNGHSTGYHYVMTGYRADFPDGNNRVPSNLLYPSIGSIVSRQLGARGSIPPYLNLPNPMGAGGPGFYGAEHAPFVIETDPVQPDFEVKDLKLPEGISSKRLEARRRLLGEIERLDRERPPAGRAGAMSAYYEKAYDLITSPAALRAFDLRAEPEETRRRYGYTSLGQCALLARRLVEAGCRFAGIDHGSWDTHFDCFPSQEKDLFPHCDRAFSALVSDLHEKGLLDTTLVVMMGEMGRTPRINARAGRDHWSMAQSVIFAGGGTRPGQVIGATDAQAAYPVTTPYGVEDILRTIFYLLGIDTTKTYYTPLGRPVPIVNGGRLIEELV
jgi:hypothetical protein